MKAVMKEIEDYILNELSTKELWMNYIESYRGNKIYRDSRLMVGIETFISNGGWKMIKQNIYDYGFVVYDGEELEDWSENWDKQINEFIYVLAVDYITTYLIAEPHTE